MLFTTWGLGQKHWKVRRDKHPETDLKFGRFWRDFRNATNPPLRKNQPLESAKKTS